MITCFWQPVLTACCIHCEQGTVSPPICTRSDATTHFAIPHKVYASCWQLKSSTLVWSNDLCSSLFRSRKRPCFSSCPSRLSVLDSSSESEDWPARERMRASRTWQKFGPFLFFLSFFLIFLSLSRFVPAARRKGSCNVNLTKTHRLKTGRGPA